MQPTRSNPPPSNVSKTSANFNTSATNETTKKSMREAVNDIASTKLLNRIAFAGFQTQYFQQRINTPFLEEWPKENFQDFHKYKAIISDIVNAIVQNHSQWLPNDLNREQCQLILTYDDSVRHTFESKFNEHMSEQFKPIH